MLPIVVTPLGDEPQEFSVATNSDNLPQIIIKQLEWDEVGRNPQYNVRHAFWRKSLHNWLGGLARDRITRDNVYSKAKADASNEGILVPPPLLTNIGLPVPAFADLYNNDGTMGTRMRYGSNAYGMMYYLGGIQTGYFHTIRQIGDVSYIAGRQYIWALGTDGVLVVIKDFITETVLDIEVKDSKLYVAMGENEPIWEYDPATTTWTQSADVYAIALGLVDDRLWRGVAINKLSNAIASPLTLASWVPATPNDYPVGDLTFPVLDIIEYGGSPWVLKQDGIYAPDARAKFHNQAPQMKSWPNPQTGHYAWTAWGYIWVASPAGLLRCQPGEAIPVGPELSGRPDFRFHIGAGVVFGDAMYIICDDLSLISETMVIRMLRDNQGGYIYHEMLRLGVIDEAKGIAIATTSIQPTMLIGANSYGFSTVFGRGGGRYIDDPEYRFEQSWELETGNFFPQEDLSVNSELAGVTAVIKLNTGDVAQMEVDIDESGNFVDLLDSQEAGGSPEIHPATGYQTVTRYAPKDSIGQFFNVKISGTSGAELQGANRPELRQLWAFGHNFPKQLDVINITLIADAFIGAMGQGKSASEIATQWRRWKQIGTTLDIKIPSYESRITQFKVGLVEETTLQTPLQGGDNTRISAIQVELLRSDLAGLYADGPRTTPLRNIVP